MNQFSDDELKVMYDAFLALRDHTLTPHDSLGVFDKLCDELKARGYSLTGSGYVWRLA